MQAGSFTASPGEDFSFTTDDGTECKGTCRELRRIDDDLIQFRGLVRSGKEALVETEILGQYNSKTGILDIIS